MTAGTFDPRLTTYFGDATLQAGFLPLPHLFLRHYSELGLSGQQAMFVMQIMAVSWDLGKPPITLSDIAQRMGIARRTAQGISAELHAKGLIEIYDQYEDGGAQTENAYDLRPLFARLATFAPASTPPGTQRQQRVRAHAATAEQPAATLSPTDTTVTPLANAGISPRQDSAPPPGRKLHPPLDLAIQPPQQESARPLKESKNLPKNPGRRQQEQQQAPAAVAARQLGWIGREEQEETGHSLRWDRPLSSAEVRKSRQVLALIGLNADVADATAPTLHPAEVWALWLHARSARLGPAWIAAQVYDRRQRRPRLAGIPAQLEASGRLLDELPLSAAVAILDITDKYAPNDLQAAQSALAADVHCRAGGQAEATFEATWAAMAKTRQSHEREFALSSPVITQPTPAPEAEDPHWVAAKVTLQATLSEAEFTTWIAPLTLLHVEETLVVIGAPNCFVRSELQGIYASALEEALEAAWGRAITVEVVIELALAA